MTTVVVIGAGPAGLMAGLAAARSGARVEVLGKGWGTLYWHAGMVDVLGRRHGDEVVDTRSAVEELIGSRPDHPYALCGIDDLEAALDDLKAVCESAGTPLIGSLDRNRRVITGVGSARPTCLVPATMEAGDADRTDPALIVGFERFTDLNPGLVAANLEAAGTAARAVTLAPRSLAGLRSVNSTVLARLFENRDFRDEVATALEPRVGRTRRVGFPAVLGMSAAAGVVAELSEQVGAEVFEIPTTPPSVPGMRIHEALVTAVRAAGGRVHVGMEAVSGHVAGDRLESVATAAAARTVTRRAGAFVLATGGILGGGIVAEPDGELREVVLGLAVDGPRDRSGWLAPDFVTDEGHPVFASGIDVDDALRPRLGDAQDRLDNVFVAGAALGRADTVLEGSHDGVALATGRTAGIAAASHLAATEGSRT